MRTLAVTGSLWLTLWGCTSPSIEDREVPEQPAPPPAQVSPDPTVHGLVLTTPLAWQHPGPAYVRSLHRLVVIDGGRWAEVRQDDPWFDLIRGGDGRVYVRGSDHLDRLEGSQRELLVSVDGGRSIEGAAIGPLGELAVHVRAPSRIDRRGHRHRGLDRTLHLYRAGQWSASPSEYEWRWGLTAFDRDGGLWSGRNRWPWHAPFDRATSSPGFEQRTRVTAHSGEWPGTVAASSTGEIYLFMEGAAQRLDLPDSPIIPLPGLTIPSAAAISPTGSFALMWSDCDAVRVVRGDIVEIEPLGVDLNCHFESLSPVIDGRDRVWIPTMTSLWVFATDGPPVEYGQGQIPLLPSGAYQVAVVGLGPELPTPGPVRTAGFAGRVLHSGQALAQRKLVLHTASSRPRPPEYRFETTTDDHGAFEFDGVPIGNYELDAETGEAWLLSDADSMREGERFDLGDLDIYNLAEIGGSTERAPLAAE